MNETNVDIRLWKEKTGYKGDIKGLYAGIDEVGVSSIAGSLVCSVVILPKEHAIERLPIDSKLLGDESITELSKEIEREALYYAVFAVPPLEVDKAVDSIGMLRLHKRVWRKAIEQGRKHYPGIRVVLDGKHTVRNVSNLLPVIGADNKYDNVSASAILSKHWCDEELRVKGKEMPDYLFEKHKGYGTQEHLTKIRAVGVSSFHRPNMTEKALEKGEDTKTYTLDELEKALREAGDYLKEDTTLANESTLPFLRQMWVQVIKDKRLPSDKQQRFAMNVCKSVIKTYKKQKKQTS